jgi:glycosyltransferase involved in cell wall biosynthesis
MMKVDIGLFAHDEEDRITTTLDSLFRQDLFSCADVDVVAHVLANGCRDATVARAEAAVAAHGIEAKAKVHDLQAAGKSRTWNCFVHDLSRPEAEFIVFLDADIQIPNPETLRLLAGFLAGSPTLAGASSRPVKDIVFEPGLKRGMTAKLIGAAGGTLYNWRTSICGQSYVLRSAVARQIHLPIGLPVEDGFVRAMVQTRNFDEEGRAEDLLDGRDELFHVYQSEPGLAALIRHQTRIVIGGAINLVIFAKIRGLSPEARVAELARSAEDPGWLPEVLRRDLPRFPFGYVPVHFLIKRLQFWARSRNRFHPKRLLLLFASFGFDAIVYVRAQYVMWRGAGAGYW